MLKCARTHATVKLPDVVSGLFTHLVSSHDFHITVPHRTSNWRGRGLNLLCPVDYSLPFKK